RITDITPPTPLAPHSSPTRRSTDLPGGGPAHQRHHGQGDPPAAAARDERRRSPPGAFHPRSAGALVPLAARPGDARTRMKKAQRSEEHTSELQSLRHLVCRLLLEKK